METAEKFNPNVKLEAHHANIKDPEFNVKWFEGFNVVFNALDNLEARRHVNKMCLSADVPLIESGTTGFDGQVQVIKQVSLGSPPQVSVAMLIPDREKPNATTARTKQFPRASRCVLFEAHLVNPFIALFGPRAIFLRSLPLNECLFVLGIAGLLLVE